MKNSIRKIPAVILSALLISSTVSCAKNAPDNIPITSEITAETFPAGLKDHITPLEAERSKETELMLLDHPWEAHMKKPGNEFKDFNKKVFFIPDLGALVYGKPVFNALPAPGYDGGSGNAVFSHYDMNTGEFNRVELVFKDYEEFKTKLKAEIDADVESGRPKPVADEDYADILNLYNAVIAGKTEPIEQDIMDAYLEYYYNGAGSSNEDSFYWEMDDKAVSAIRESIHEYHLYDEELDTGFTVHLITPPKYDPATSYPALVMTDAVWRFKDVTALWDEMAKGKAAPQILITIGFEYDVDGWDNEVRGNILCDHKKEFLDFITDNMMPYLSALYPIDFESSTLFGHSQGGVFTHYAAFNYDLYENRPFKRYIIGSPTFWTPYFTSVSDYSDYKTEYGFFQRNDSYDRELLITYGEREDEDYKEYYGDNDSTSEGVAHLKDRLDAAGVDTYEIRTYPGNHYQYVSKMLVEYVEYVGEARSA